MYDDEEVSLSDLIPKKRKRKVSDPSGLKGDRQLDAGSETTVKTEVKFGMAFTVKHFLFARTLCLRKFARAWRRENKVLANNFYCKDFIEQDMNYHERFVNMYKT